MHNYYLTEVLTQHLSTHGMGHKPQSNMLYMHLYIAFGDEVHLSSHITAVQYNISWGEEEGGSEVGEPAKKGGVHVLEEGSL